MYKINVIIIILEKVIKEIFLNVTMT